MFADKSEIGLKQKVEKSFQDKGVRNEHLAPPPKLIEVNNMFYFFIETTL